MQVPKFAGFGSSSSGVQPEELEERRFAFLVADPHHAEVDRGEGHRRHGLELGVLEEAYVLEAVRLLDVADDVLL